MGAIFQTARDVFRLVATINAILRDWESNEVLCADGKLFMLVNSTEVCTISPGQALTLSSEGGPNFISRALSEI